MVANRTKTVTMIFKREELLYDCRNLGYVEGDVMQTEDQHAKHQVQDIGEDGNVDWVTRVLNLGVARCVELLYPYSKVPVDDYTEMDDELLSPESYEVSMLVPDDFSQTTVNLLTNYIHMLLVYMVMEQWMSLTNVGNKWSKSNWAEKIAETEELIKGSLNARIGRVRKTQTPF